MQPDQEPSMNATTLRNTLSALIISVAFVGTSHAAYLCDDPPSPVDKRACEAAEQGPDVLRRFIERIKPVHNLYFFDYVNEARLVAWDASDARARAQKDAAKTANAATSTERR